MRVRSELDGREWQLDRPVEWVEAGRLPRTGRVTPEDVSEARAYVSPAPGQAAWAQVSVGTDVDPEGGETLYEPVQLLDDGKGVEEAWSPYLHASPEALRIAALSTDAERKAALLLLEEQPLASDDLLELVERNSWRGRVARLLAWTYNPALYCTLRREDDAELEEAESVHFRVRPRSSSPEGQ